jgi:hypothetical protein
MMVNQLEVPGLNIAYPIAPLRPIEVKAIQNHHDKEKALGLRNTES